MIHSCRRRGGFPRDVWPPEDSEEVPSGMRPFVLRGAQQLHSVVTTKHRTAHADKTTNDGTSQLDTWYEQDD